MVQLRTLLATSLALPLTLARPRHIDPIKSFDETDETPLPLIIWHGLGDNFANPGLNSVADLATETVEGLFTYIIRLADNPNEDSKQTFLGDVNEQVDRVCADLAAHPILSTAPAVDAIGFSQGGQFLRAYVQRCNFPKVRNLITFGSQHNGIVNFQNCGTYDFVCKGAQLLLKFGTWTETVQKQLVPAQYFRDPAAQEYENYLLHSNFLADINNERELKNETYKENLASLETFVMYMFDQDTTVIPKETSWFAEVVEGEMIPLENRTIYTEDWIGLKKLGEENRLVYDTIEGEHMAMTDKVLEYTFRTYLGPEGKKFDHPPKKEASSKSQYSLVEEL